MSWTEPDRLPSSYRLLRTFWFTFFGALLIYLMLVFAVKNFQNNFNGFIQLTDQARHYLLLSFSLLGLFAVFIAQVFRGRMRNPRLPVEPGPEAINEYCQYLESSLLKSLVFSDAAVLLGLVLYLLQGELLAFFAFFCGGAASLLVSYPTKTWWNELIAQLASVATTELQR